MHLLGLVSSLELAQEYTADDHPDQESLSMIIGTMADFIKMTQVEVEAAETKVKFWTLCESLKYQKGEMVVNLLLLSPMVNMFLT